MDLRLPVKENLRLIAKAKGLDIRQINVSILDRDRHRQLAQEIRDAGAVTMDVAKAVNDIKGGKIDFRVDGKERQGFCRH